MPVEGFPFKVDIQNAESLNSELVIPKEATAGQRLHLILEATDNGTPALTTYKRVILEVRQR